MSRVISDPALRIKMTGVCNRTCHFCNEEGDMKTIGSIEPSPSFFQCVHSLLDELEIKKVMLTGGEPTIHPALLEIVDGVKSTDISITTNGIRTLPVDTWDQLKNAGLRMVIMSIHDATPQSFVQLETRRREFGWAVRSLEAQKANLAAASKAGLQIRVNTVAYNSYDQVLTVLDSLSDLQREYRFDIRLLNDLGNVERSQLVIQQVCQSLGATVLREERRAGSSNATVLWEAESGFRFSTKMAFKYFFEPICQGCSIRSSCHEGFYGIRLERRLSDYWVRLCIYRHTPEVLMPWREFLQSGLAVKFKDICQQDLS